MSKVVRSSLFTLKINEEKDGKVKFSVSKKVDKRATRRNRIRRLFKASIQNLLGDIRSNNFLFIIKKEALSQNQQEIESQIKSVFKKEKLIK